MKQDKIDKILQLIKNDKAQENHLFKTLEITDKPFPLLKPLKEAGYFHPCKNPSPIEGVNQKGYFTIPHWNVLGYLENTSKHNKQNPSEKITNLLLNIINPIIDYETNNKERIDNYRTDWIFSKIIFLLPLDKIESRHFKFIRTALNSRWDTTLIASEIGKSIIPILLKEKSIQLLTQLFDIVLDYKVVDKNSVDKYVSLVDKYWLNEALKQHKKALFELCGKEIAGLALTKIAQIIEEDKSQFNNVWIPTIEDHPQTSFPDRYECQLVYLIRDFYQTAKPQTISDKINKFISQEHPIYQRLTLHLINHHYISLNPLFWKWTTNPLEVPLVKHELYELLKNHCNSLKADQLELAIKWIEEKDYYISEEHKDDEKLVDKIIAYRKKEWLSALINTNNQMVINLYNKYDTLNPTKLDHPGFDSWSESSWGSVSPIEEVDLLSKTVNEIVSYLIDFQEKGGWKDPTIDGLSGILKKCVSENTDKFTDGISSFLGVKRVYQHALLGGFSDAWRSKKQIDWKSIFKFINGLLEAENFWKENYQESGYHYRNWIISQIADLINDGTKNDQHAFNSDYLPDAERILLLLVDKVESDFYAVHDIVTSVLNSVKGKVFTAMVNFSLRYARLNVKDDEKRWKESIKSDFTKRLDKGLESSLDFSVVMGEYLPNLYYLDKKWIVSNIENVFPKVNETHWQAAFTGYLFYSSTVYAHLYKLLAKNGHYAKALNIEFDDDHITERVAQHICVAYIENWERFEDKNSLINALLKSSNKKYLSAIISFFWMQRDLLTEKIKNKIKPLWKNLYLRLEKNKEDKKYDKLISDTSKWLILVDEIDDEIDEWLSLAVTQIETNFNAPFFIEYLLKHVEKTPIKVAKLYLEMLNKGFYPDFKKEHILEIITMLNEKNLKEKAINICNLYLNKGYEFTRPILETIHSE